MTDSSNDITGYGFLVGDVVLMKKAHPCGSSEWEILRVGMDFRLKCRKCGRLVLLPRAKFERGFKRFISRADIDTLTNPKS